MTVETHVAQYEIWRDAAETLCATLPNVADAENGETHADALDNALRHGHHHRDITLYVLPASVNLEHASYASDNDLPELPQHRDELYSLADTGFLSVETIVNEESSSAYLDDDRIVLAVTVHHAFKLVPVTYRWNEGSRTGAYSACLWTVGETITIVPAGVYVIGQSGNAYHRSTDIIRYVGENADTESLFYQIMEDEEFGASQAIARCSVNEEHVWTAESGSWRFSPADYFDAANAPFPGFAFDDAEFSRVTAERQVLRCFDPGCAHLEETECFNTVGHDSETRAPAGQFFCPVDGCTGTVGILVH